MYCTSTARSSSLIDFSNDGVSNKKENGSNEGIITKQLPNVTVVKDCVAARNASVDKRLRGSFRGWLHVTMSIPYYWRESGVAHKVLAYLTYEVPQVRVKSFPERSWKSRPVPEGCTRYLRSIRYFMY